MLEDFIGGLLQVLTWPTFGFLLFGVVCGWVIGILPGIGTVVTLSIMIPFTYDIEPVAAFALLLSTAAVSSTAGDMTSILFGVPGSADAAALVVDGYPMSKKGEAGRALSANLVASLVGAVVGAVAIVLAVPIVRPLVLSLGSPEFFMLTVVGMAFVSVLSSKAPVKGLIAGLLGLLISQVGMNFLAGVDRFTFGQLHLWGGVGIVPLALGLFAIPELYELTVRGTSIADRPYSKLMGVMQGVRDVLVHRWLVVRCSLIGTFVGIIPGLGGTVAQWIAYGHAVQSSPDKERFGRGAVEGTIGPGAANNSGLGGQLIPTIAFGIPGGVVMAVLLGAFTIHGISPGPSLLTTRLDLTMSFVWVIVLSNVIAVLVSFLFLEHIARVTFIRGVILVPVITILVFIGAFTATNAMLDILVVLLSGALGIGFMLLGWPRPPLILGAVLGSLAEEYLFLSVGRYGFDFLARPLVFVFALVAALVMLQPWFAKGLTYARRRRISVNRPETASPTSNERVSQSTHGPSVRQLANLLLTAVMLMIGSSALWVAQSWPIGASLMPTVVAVPLALLSGGYLLLQALRPSEKYAADGEFGDIELNATTIRRTYLFAGWMLASAAFIWLIGFQFSSLLVLAWLRLVARERWMTALVISISVAICLWILQYQLHIPFRDGLLFAFVR